MIVSKMTSSEQVKANLRIIKERIIHSKDSIINKQIPLVKQLEGRYITTKSTFTYFLSLLNSFNIKFETLKKTLPKEELISIVGKNWYLIEQFTNDIHFILNGDSLNISYTIDHRGSYYKEFVTDPYFSMKLESDKKELLECKIHYSENSNNILTNMMYDYIDKIVIFLNKNVLI